MDNENNNNNNNVTFHDDEVQNVPVQENNVNDVAPNVSVQENNINYHEEEIQNENVKKPMCKFSIYAMVCAVASILCSVVALILQKDTVKEVFNMAMQSSEEMSTSEIASQISTNPVANVLNKCDTVFLIAAIILAIIAIKQAKKKALRGKGLAIWSIIVGVIGGALVSIIATVVVLGPTFSDEITMMSKCMDSVYDCVDNGDGTSACYTDGEPITCRNEYLREADE